jgi:hypothetical protein
MACRSVNRCLIARGPRSAPVVRAIIVVVITVAPISARASECVGQGFYGCVVWVSANLAYGTEGLRIGARQDFSLFHLTPTHDSRPADPDTLAARIGRAWPLAAPPIKSKFK